MVGMKVARKEDMMVETMEDEMVDYLAAMKGGL